MVENLRDPNNKYMKKEDVEAMKIPYLSRIEIGVSPHAKNDVDRGDTLETRMGYYVGIEKCDQYDALQYADELINGEPYNERGIMLPIVDFIKILRTD